MIITRSVALSTNTRSAWQQAGFKIWPRQRTFADLPKDEIVVNLGNLKVQHKGVQFNARNTCMAVSKPMALRNTMPDFLPPRNRNADHWHKVGGWGGRGVEFHATPVNCGFVGELQEHIVGEEYRVITVADKVVQVTKKTNGRWHDGRHYFDWDWVGVDAVKSVGIIPHVKAALETVPNGNLSVFGWDIILADRDAKVYTIEVNTSPGVNVATAERIARAIRKEIYHDGS